jgi:hypothetical protein
MNRFNVIRLSRGSHKGKIFVIPTRPFRPIGTRRLLLRADWLLTGVSYEAAFWYATGLLWGETGTYLTPYVKSGRSEAWKKRLER